MKCPYRKITYHRPADNFHCAYDEEGFSNCYGEECPYYAKSVDNFNQREYGDCLRALKEV